jgi:hypothetical protein
MDKAWLRAAGRNGIPCAFVVDRDGMVAWIGHPELLALVLEEVTRGTWDVVSGPGRLRMASAAFADAAAKYKEGLAVGEQAWNRAAERYPALGRSREPQRFGALLRSGHFAEACALGGRLVDRAKNSRNPGPIMGVLEALGDPGILKEAPVRALLLKAAVANFELADVTEPGPHVVMARACFYAGRDAEAHAAAEKALSLATERTRRSLERWLRDIEREARQAVEGHK